MAGIIKTLEDRGFIKLEGKRYISTQKGRELIGLIPEELKDKNMRIRFEEELLNTPL